MSLDIEDVSRLPLSLRREVAENIYRKDLTETELAAVQSKLKKEFRKYSEQGKRTDLEERDGGEMGAELLRKFSEKWRKGPRNLSGKCSTRATGTWRRGLRSSKPREKSRISMET
ncbi:hypothetical protein AKJ65_01535 [candidate division MSBL1 archaeon SCGC-AAA259E19]|uniref:Uncharacterized protein n=1 Tax=candidate division MSBL1 archaeon SCGC-AAA259E19 TaxID=1698264 RepID=A0A133UMU4_9EURY|nr:hypothetical protein AKJ65_01535 [candidate division MSBL1 archaeon SCGC-AAA259E19]